MEPAAVIVTIPSALVSSSNTLDDGSAAVENNIGPVDEVECTIVLLLIVSGGFDRGTGRPDIGY